MSKVLIIEDDQIVANIYRNKFLVEGYEVEIALDGETGLEKIQAFNPDAIVLDLMMPGMDGPTMVEQIRRIDPQLPVLGMTGIAERAEARLNRLKDQP